MAGKVFGGMRGGALKVINDPQTSHLSTAAPRGGRIDNACGASPATPLYLKPLVVVFKKGV